MSFPMWIIDAFTSVPFRGNPAAVCLMEKFPNDKALQLIALQMNLSETAFLVKKKSLDYDLRWFTPETEVKLCGHATLAAAHALQQAGEISPGDAVKFNTLSGELKAEVLERGIELDFPALPGKPVKLHPALAALNANPLFCERNGTMYLVELRDYKTLLECKPDFKKLQKIDAIGVIVTTATGVPAGFDFASRFFAPGIGINEDPVCGSAHCFLTPYWAKKLKQNSFNAFQASKGQGVLQVTLKGDRVLIAGNAVTTLKGELPEPRKASVA